MPAPGSEVQILEAPRPRSPLTATGTAFIVAEAERGPASPQPCRSLGEVVATFGGRQAYSFLYDWAETFFREGGALLWVSRVVADAAAVASADLSDGTDPTLRVLAAGPGAYGNALRAIVRTSADDPSIPAGSFQVRVTYSDGTSETSPSFADKAEAIAWASANGRTFKLADLAGADNPVRVAAPGTLLAGGDDDRAGITDAEWTEALDRLHKDLGPGQVAAPGRTTTPMHTALLDHARLRNRHAKLDLPDSTDAAAIAAAQAADAATVATRGGRYGEGLWPWHVIPGLTTYSSRVVPPSAAQAALDSRVDGKGNPNQAAAGIPDGELRFVTGLTQDVRALTEAQREALNDAGVNVFMQFGPGGAPTQFGNRTLRPQAQDPTWYQASGSRLSMFIAAGGDEILRRYVHKQVDGKRVTQSGLEGELSEMLGRLYDKGAIFGDTPADAYAVDVGPAVNTPESIAAGQLRAHLAFRASPGAERVVLELVRVAVNEAVA